MSTSKIQPRILKGFRDYLPQITIPRTEMIDRIKEVFLSFGYVPIDTPALEYADILLGKGSAETDKQLFRFLDNGGRDVALRFDLTVPLARFSAMHLNDLGLPFRRYHIAPVWRAEKPQRGRFREFMQCDFDIIGTRSMVADAEILALIHQALTAVGVPHRIRLNNRLILNGLLARLNAEDKSTAVLRAIDKLEKLGRETVEHELESEAALSANAIADIFAFIALSEGAKSNGALLEELKTFFPSDEKARRGILELEQIFTAAAGYGITDDVCTLDLRIARGLDYYTATVFETDLTALPEIGSICSGGRYDNLAALYSSQDLPGVGASIGLDRLLAALEELGRVAEKTSSAKVLVTCLDPGTEAACFSLAKELRENGIAAELYPGPAKLGLQLKYADRKHLDFAVIAGQEELDRGELTLKNLSTGTQTERLTVQQIAEKIR